MTEKPKRDYAIHVNQVEILGRITDPPRDDEVNKVTRVFFLVPTWTKEGQQWLRLPIDIVGDGRAKVRDAKPGYYLRCTGTITERVFKSDAGEEKAVKVLQSDPYRELAIMAPEKAPENPLNPPMDGICHSRVLLAGRHFVRKADREKGITTPVIREGNNGAYCYVNLRYVDPYQQVQGDEWPKALYFDFSLNGDVAKRFVEHCQYRAQLLVRGELVKKDLDFTVRGKTANEVRVRPLPGGVQFHNVDGPGGGAKREPQPAQGYQKTESTAALSDDDIPF